MRTIAAYGVCLLGMYAGVYFYALINAIVSKLCGMELMQFTVFNRNIVKKDGKLTVVKRPFSPYCMSIFKKEGASEGTLTAIEITSYIAAVIASILLLVPAVSLLIGKGAILRYTAEFIFGIICFCVVGLIQCVITNLSKNSSVNGRTKYIIKQLQAGKNLNDIDVSLEKLASLDKPDNMRGVYLSMNFMKLLYNEQYDKMRETVNLSENFINKTGVPQKIKDFAINDVFTYYILPYTIETEGEGPAKMWYEKWIKTLKIPYDAGDNRRIAAYNFYILHDTETAKKALALAEEKLSSWPGTPFEKELQTKEIEKLKKAIYGGDTL